MVTAKQPRRRKAPTYQRFRYSKRIKSPVKLSSGFKLFKQSLKPFKQNWKLFLGLILIYAFLSIVFVRGFSATSNLPSLKSSLDLVFKGTGGQLTTGFTLFGVLLGSAGGSSATAGVYQSILFVIMALTFIWVLRSVQADNKAEVKLKDGFYKGMYALIPFLLVIVIIALQLIPLLVGASLYSIVISNGLAVTGLEQFIWGAGFFILAVWSLYMVAPSILALFIVTLPNMAPIKALRASRNLVRHRRWTILRKELFLPLALVVILGVLLIPVILWATVVAEWVYFGLSLIMLPVTLSYLYTLYKELL